MTLVRDPVEIFYELNGTLPNFTSAEGKGPYLYIDGGCRDNNCAAVCTDPSWLFSSTDALSSCIAASYIAANLTNSTDQHTRDEALEIGIFADSPAMDKVASTVAGCISSYCGFSSFCTQNNTTCTEDTLLTNGALNGDVLQQCYENLCSGLSLAVDPDIGGIGVGTPR